MRIIKKGSPKLPHIFNCNYCGCEFEVEYEEYKIKNYKNTVIDSTNFFCKCPCCKKLCISREIHKKDLLTF